MFTNDHKVSAEINGWIEQLYVDSIYPYHETATKHCRYMKHAYNFQKALQFYMSTHQQRNS